MLGTVNRFLNKYGYGFVKLSYYPMHWDMNSEGDLEFRKLHAQCAPYAMSSVERMYALYQAACYVARHSVDGDFVECGVFRGASSMLAALSLRAQGVEHKDLYLYDTFAGMPPPTEQDRDFGGRCVEQARGDLGVSSVSDMYAASLDEVKTHMALTGYSAHRIRYVVGKVEDTIPKVVPDKISILRLDTDWYESTYHELVHLYPLLVSGGVLIIDDYGHWQGARRAVDQYLAESGARILLNRIDYTGRIAVKP